MLTEKEKQILLHLFKDFTTRYNARSISAKVDMTPRGALKALKALEEQQFVIAEPFGKAIEYKFNAESALAKKTIELFLLEEAEQEHKRWLEEFKNFEEAEILLLFGSAARKAKSYNDVDLLIVVTQENFPLIKKRIEDKNKILIKKIHTIFQAPNDLPENIKKKDPVVLDAIRTGVVLKGWTQYVEVIANVTNK
ncbi:nucleotidyltransferase domain-containing protein [Candidatus Woesearchaeota archaeon]|nr:nucleotidyltransferase domain-containing protein [Candidatus Woesearchaeota archaeon]